MVQEQVSGIDTDLYVRCLNCFYDSTAPETSDIL